MDKYKCYETSVRIANLFTDIHYTGYGKYFLSQQFGCEFNEELTIAMEDTLESLKDEYKLIISNENSIKRELECLEKRKSLIKSKLIDIENSKKYDENQIDFLILHDELYKIESKQNDLIVSSNKVSKARVLYGLNSITNMKLISQANDALFKSVELFNKRYDNLFLPASKESWVKCAKEYDSVMDLAIMRFTSDVPCIDIDGLINFECIDIGKMLSTEYNLENKFKVLVFPNKAATNNKSICNSRISVFDDLVDYIMDLRSRSDVSDTLFNENHINHKKGIILTLSSELYFKFSIYSFLDRLSKKNNTSIEEEVTRLFR